MEQIIKFMSESRKVIIVFTEHFMASEFCRVELDIAMNRHLLSNTRCIVPVVHSEKDIPTEVKQRITYLSVMKAEKNVAERIAQNLG